MKYANLTLPSRKLCFVVALAAGIMSFPLSTKAEQAVQNVQQTGVVKGQVTDKNGDAVIGATVKVKDAHQVPLPISMVISHSTCRTVVLLPSLTLAI